MNNPGKTKTRVSKFEPKTIQEGSAIFIIGKRGSGTSWLIRNLLDVKGWNDIATIISPTERMSPFFKNRVKEIHYSIPNTLLDDIKTNTDQHKVIVLDRIFPSKKDWLDHAELLSAARLHNTTLIVAEGYAAKIPPETGIHFDYVFAFRESSDILRRRLYERYTNCFDSFDQFNCVMASATLDYGTMVIDRCRPGFNAFWYKFSLDCDSEEDRDTRDDSDNNNNTPEGQEADIQQEQDSPEDTDGTKNLSPRSVSEPAEGNNSCNLL